MTLFADEAVLVKEAELTVTTHRVRYGDAHSFTSMLLEEICAVRTKRVSFKPLLLLALTLWCVAAAMGYQAHRALEADSLDRMKDFESGGWAVFGIGAVFLLGYIFVTASAPAHRLCCHIHRLPDRSVQAEQPCP